MLQLWWKRGKIGMMKKCLIFILTLTLFTGIFGLESHAAESEVFLDPFPIYRLSLTKDEETVMYTAFYMQDFEGNIYLISSAFAGAAMRDGWEATLHTASGEKDVEHLKNENGICYLKAEIPEQICLLELEDDDEYEDGYLLCAKKTEEKAADGSVITKYTWGKWYVDFLGWHRNGSYYVNDEIYMSKVYLEDVKLYGAPLVNLYGDSIHLIGTLYLDVNYCPIVVDFRKLGLSEEYAIGKAEVSEDNDMISDFMVDQLNALAASEEEVVINIDTLPEIEEEVISETEKQSVSESNNLPMAIAGVVVAAAVIYFRKRKQNT